MTSLQNQIIKYGKKKHFGSAKDFFFFCAWEGSGQFVIPACVGAQACAERQNAKLFSFSSKGLQFSER